MSLCSKLTSLYVVACCVWAWIILGSYCDEYKFIALIALMGL